MLGLLHCTKLYGRQHARIYIMHSIVPFSSFTGSAGQSFACFLTPGMNIRLVGEANDYVGKVHVNHSLAYSCFPFVD